MRQLLLIVLFAAACSVRATDTTDSGPDGGPHVVDAGPGVSDSNSDAGEMVTLTVQVRDQTGSNLVVSNDLRVNCTDAVCVAEYPPGATVVLQTFPDMVSTFVGWSSPCSGIGACQLTLTSDTTITATFAPLPIQGDSLTVSVTGMGSVTSAPAGIDCGSTCTAMFDDQTMVSLTAQPGAGDVFKSWSGAACSGQGNPCAFNIQHDTTVSAKFIAGYALTFVFQGTGTGEVDAVNSTLFATANETVGVASGTMLTLEAGPDVGSVFSGWGGDCPTMTGKCVLTMNQPHTVQVTFTFVDLELTVQVTGPGSITSASGAINCGNGHGACSDEVQSGAMVNLTATPAASGAFSGWGSACAGLAVNSCTVDMNMAQTVTATFIPAGMFPLTVQIAGNGSGTVGPVDRVETVPLITCGVSTCTAMVPAGLFPEEAIAATGSQVMWSGDCNGATTAVCPVVMDGPKTITATFTPAVPDPVPVSAAFAAGRVVGLDSAGNLVTIGGGVIVEYALATQQVLWSLPLTGDAVVANPAVDSSDDIFLAGYFTNTTGTLAVGSTKLKQAGTGYTPFMAEVSDTGALVWAQTLTGTGSPNAIAVDASGDLYVSGSLASSNEDLLGTQLQLGSTTLTSPGLFVAKFASNGDVTWATEFANACAFGALAGLAVDGSGDIYVGGSTGKSIANSGSVTFGSTTLTPSGDDLGFVAKLDSNGNALWAKEAASTVNGLTLDSAGDLLVAGGSSTSAEGGVEGLALTTFAPDGTRQSQMISTVQEGSASAAMAVATDSAGNVWLTGVNTETAFQGIQLGALPGSVMAFVVKLDPSGNVLEAQTWGRDIFKDDTGAYGDSIAVRSDGTAVVGGIFTGEIDFIGDDLLEPPDGGVATAGAFDIWVGP